MAEAIATDRAASDLAASFRCAMRRLASGVAVVTALGEEGDAGMAATSVTSLAMDPLSLLVCVNRQAGLHPCLPAGARFVVNILTSTQREVAAAFGGAVDRPLRFTVGEWSRDAHGLRRLDGAQANLSCVVDQMIAYGTHSIVIGRVDAVRTSGQVAPLIYQDGKYL